MTPSVLVRVKASRVNPYPGLVPFEEKDAQHFFGRDTQIDEIIERLASHRLLAVIGVSGCGKSSLVRAGVIPVLRLGAAESLPGRWKICTFSPGSEPVQALRMALGAGSAWPATSFDLIEYTRTNLNAGENLMLIVDQFEELFRFRAGSLPRDGGNTAALFVNLLLNAVDQHEVPIYVLITMRTDFLGECAQFRGLPEALNDCYYLVPRLTRLQQQEAIERPLQEQGVEIAPAVVQRLLNDSAEEPDQLPVLQHLLKRMWENWDGAERPISLLDYDAVGGWTDAINREAEGVLNRFKNEYAGIRRLFEWITERGTGGKPVRRPRPVTECVEVSGISRDRLAVIVRAFQERGLLRPFDKQGTSLIDLPHESVMWYWAQLGRWIAEEAEHAAQLRFLLQSAQRKVRLIGLALESARKLRSDWQTQKLRSLRYVQEEDLDQIDRWLNESERLAKKEKRWRFWTWGIAGAASVVLSALAIQAWLTQRERDLAEARELSAWAALSLTDDPERSLILGLRAWKVGRAIVPGLQQLLHEAVLESHVRRTLRGHEAPVWGIAWSPDGTKLATASEDKTAKVWEARSGRQLLTLRGHEASIWSIAWSPDGSKLATASDDKTAKVWDASTGHTLLTLHGHQASARSIAWSPDGTRLATASFDNTGKVWEASTGRELLTLRGHQGYVWAIAWSRDGSKLATASDDKTARVWNAKTGNHLQTLTGHGEPLWSVAWSPDGRKLATASTDNTARVWEASTGHNLLTFSDHHDHVWSVEWSPDGRKVASGSDDNTAKIWDASTGQQLVTMHGHQGSVWSVAWSPDGTKLATASDDNMAKVWEAGTGRELPILRGHGAFLRSIVWSPDGRKVATGSDDKSAKIWDASTGRQLVTLKAHQGAVSSVGWSPDGSKLATASSDNTAKVWAADSGQELLTLRGHEGSVWSIAWSPDGSKLATAGWDKTAKVWDAHTGRALLQVHGHEASVWSIAWSPDGSKLGTGSDDSTARTWDARTGQKLQRMDGHQGSVWSVAWSPDSKKLATASWDKTVKVWDARSGREVLTLHAHEGPVYSVAWERQGKRLASAGGDGIAQLYVMDPNELLKVVQSRMTRDLTPGETRRFLSRDR
jgi:WD40 repeat protein